VTAREIFGRYGVSAVYKGFIPTAIRESLFTCGYLGLGPVLKEQLISAAPETFKDKPMLAAALGSIFAGLLAASLTQPADTVKTRLQGDINGPATVYKSPLQAAKLIYTKVRPHLLFLLFFLAFFFSHTLLAITGGSKDILLWTAASWAAHDRRGLHPRPL